MVLMMIVRDDINYVGSIRYERNVVEGVSAENAFFGRLQVASILIGGTTDNVGSLEFVDSHVKRKSVYRLPRWHELPSRLGDAN